MERTLLYSNSRLPAMLQERKFKDFRNGNIYIEGKFNEVNKIGFHVSIHPKQFFPEFKKSSQKA